MSVVSKKTRFPELLFQQAGDQFGLLGAVVAAVAHEDQRSPEPDEETVY